MTDNSNRYGSEPLGKSVEEVESESGNLENSPVSGEAVRDAENEASVVPALVNGNATGIPAVVRPEALVERGGEANDGRMDRDRDASEES